MPHLLKRKDELWNLAPSWDRFSHLLHIELTQERQPEADYKEAHLEGKVFPSEAVPLVIDNRLNRIT